MKYLKANLDSATMIVFTDENEKEMWIPCDEYNCDYQAGLKTYQVPKTLFIARSLSLTQLRLKLALPIPHHRLSLTKMAL